MTAVGFGLWHPGVTCFSGSELLLFVGLDLPPGLAWGTIIQRTNTVWGAVLAHAVADGFLMAAALRTLA